MTRAEIRKLSEAKDEDALKARLGSRMSFGTAGSVVASASDALHIFIDRSSCRHGSGIQSNEPTYNNPNNTGIIYHLLRNIILMTCQGLCEFILKEFKDARQRGVVVGRDARRNSEM